MHQCSIGFVLRSVWSWFKTGLAWTGRPGNGGLWSITFSANWTQSEWLLPLPLKMQCLWKLASLPNKLVYMSYIFQNYVVFACFCFHLFVQILFCLSSHHNPYPNPNPNLNPNPNSNPNLNPNLNPHPNPNPNPNANPNPKVYRAILKLCRRATKMNPKIYVTGNIV